jgi:hypothetical protein
MAERRGGHAGAGDWPAVSDLPEKTFQDAFKALDARDRQRKAERKSGSAMSDKQMARAAVSGQLLVFRTGVLMPMEGYVVGMDDFHWMVATPSNEAEGEGVQTTLIHKTCPLVTFTEQYLVDENDGDRQKIQQIGGAFWEFCLVSGLVRTLPIDQEQKL